MAPYFLSNLAGHAGASLFKRKPCAKPRHLDPVVAVLGDSK